MASQSHRTSGTRRHWSGTAPISTRFRKLRSLERGDAATCLIVTEGDLTVPPGTAEELAAAARSIGPCEVILEPRPAKESDPHFGEPLRSPAVLSRYLQFLGR